MDSTARPEMDYEAETLLARISHRLERLYNIMQKDRNTVAKERYTAESFRALPFAAASSTWSLTNHFRGYPIISV